MPKLFAALLTVAMVAGISPARADATADAKKLGDLFCLVAMDARDGGEFGRLYLVTRSLGAAIDEAIRKNDEIAAAEPGDKPPLGDGVPFQSYPDDASGLPCRQIRGGRRQADRRGSNTSSPTRRTPTGPIGWCSPPRMAG